MNLTLAMRRFSIRLRMLGAIASVILLLLLVGGAGLSGMFAIRGSADHLFEHAFHEAQALSALKAEMLSMAASEKDMVIAFEQADAVNRHKAEWSRHHDLVIKHIDSMLEGEEDDDNVVLREMKQSLASYVQGVGPVAAQLAAGGYDTATVAYRMLETSHAALAKATAAQGKLEAIITEEANAGRAEMDQSISFTMALFGACVVVSLVIVVPTTLANSSSITRPIGHASEVARAIAGGDLAYPIRTEGQDETATLLRSLADMQQALSRLVGNVRDASDSIRTASAEVAQGNTDLSHRTEEAASNLQRTASSMEQLTGTVTQTSDSARTANQLASSASDVARRGGDVVAQVVATMEDINSSSRKIGDIIGTIDGIAFQTNILALNAAVEAARAGEQGRGFAVVASEVRSLAQRSAEAAREIKTLIGASVDKVESGTRLVADAGTTMTEIVASVQRVTDIIGEITAATTEQSGGINQVNSAVTALDQMTQQNAALVEQSAAAAESLREQAQRLSDEIAVFRVDGASSSHRSALPA